MKQRYLQQLNGDPRCLKVEMDDAKIPAISMTTVRLDNAPREESCIYPHSINNFLEERPSEGKEDCIQSIIEWEFDDTKKTLGLRQQCRNQFVAPVIPVEVGPFNKNTHNFNSNTTNNGIMPQLSEDDELQCEKKDLPELLSLLKDKYMYHGETNKNILYDYEIERFAKLYCITNFYLSHLDSMMICEEHDMKEALINFLFHEKNLYYIEEYTLRLIPVKKAKEEAKKWYEENKHTTTKIVITDELLKPLEEKKNEFNKGVKQKKKK
ncbi:1271_t:CDS:2 [Funneliformis caledonium]|uniref:1271_t:CDS:1 n=1 Tax=Funneliformis caledonium TaxID=1117310 RepID=A0A9N9C1K8_9GLOM|nr:1271_t:CDS:2 [Funneliformis caledonium]